MKISIRKTAKISIAAVASVGVFIWVVASLLGFLSPQGGPRIVQDPRVGLTPPAQAVSLTRISTWGDEGGNDLTQSLTKDFSSIAAATGASDTHALSAACGLLDDDVSRAQNYPAIPDADAQSHWSSALAHDHMAAVHCTAGVATSDPSAMADAAIEMDAATVQFRDVTDRFNQIEAGS